MLYEPALPYLQRLRSTDKPQSLISVSVNKFRVVNAEILYRNIIHHVIFSLSKDSLWAVNLALF
jgi:hypothetical protein